MTPQRQKSQPKVVKANGKGQPRVIATNQKTQPVDWEAIPRWNPRVGKPFWNTARTAPSTGKGNLRIPSSTFGEAG